MLLGAVKIERRQKLSIRHRFEMVGVAAYANEFLDVRVPGSDVVVGDRPVHAVAELLRCDELVLAPALAGAGPDDRLAPDLVAANPVERFRLDVWVVAVLDEEMHGVLAVTRRFADQRILLEDLTGQGAAVRQLPRLEIHGRIVLDVDYVPTALEHERLQPLLAQLLCRPAARDAGADYDGVVRTIRSHRFCPL